MRGMDPQVIWMAAGLVLWGTPEVFAKDGRPRTHPMNPGKPVQKDSKPGEPFPTPSNPAGIEWVTIPGGTFQIRSNEGYDLEKPVHRVSLKSFQIAKTEVTVGQYRECVAAGVCTPPGTGGRCNWGVEGREGHPVHCVDWHQAKAFAEWVGGRLPTEAKWEYAARSGGKEWKYSWGNVEATSDRAVIWDGGNGCGQEGTWPVCSKPKGNTEQGQCDMAGNAWEWVQDEFHGSYEGAPTDGSAWEKPEGSGRVARGVAWVDDAGGVRVAFRGRGNPADRQGNLGLRPARSLP